MGLVVAPPVVATAGVEDPDIALLGESLGVRDAGEGLAEELDSSLDEMLRPVKA